MHTAEGVLAADNAVVFACFESAERLYGIDVLQIREIVRAREVTPLPRAPELIEGVVDLRGAVIPVLDLARILGGEPAAESSATRIAVLEVEGMAVGLRVEAAVDVLSVDAAAIESPPALVTHAGYDAVRAVIRRDEAAPVMVLSLENLLELVYRSALEPSP
jgi:purine-binding chemotaxis protein CheW